MTLVGTVERAASESRAAARPWSSTAGWMPRASSRSSASDWASSSLAVVASCSAVAGSLWMRPWSRRSCSAMATRRCWAPSCRLRSRRRRSASPAATMRSREACISASRCPGLLVQTLVLQSDAGCGADGLDQLGIVVERGVVDERGELGAARSRPWRSSGRPRPGAPAPAGRRSRRNPGTRAAGRPPRGSGRRGSWPAPPCRSPPRRVVEVAEEVREAAARQPRAQQPDEERRRYADQREDRSPQHDLRARAGHEVVGQQRGEEQQGRAARDARAAARGAAAATPRATEARRRPRRRRRARPASERCALSTASAMSAFGNTARRLPSCS